MNATAIRDVACGPVVRRVGEAAMTDRATPDPPAVERSLVSLPQNLSSDPLDLEAEA